MKLEKGMRIVNKSTSNLATIVEISPNFNIIDSTIVAKYEGLAEVFTLSKEDFNDFWNIWTPPFDQIAGSTADKVVRAVPRMENPYFPTRTYYKNDDVYTEPVPEHAEFEKKQQEAIDRTKMNPFADKPNPTYPLDDDKIKYREGFRLACQVISIKAAKHLGPQHPVMLMIASLQEE